MDNIDREYIRRNLMILDERDSNPLEPGSDYDDMSMREMKLLLEHMSRLLEEADIRDARSQEQVRLANDRADRNEERADRNEERADRLAEQVSELLHTLKTAQLTIEELKDTIANLTNQLTADRGARFGSSSQKGTGGKKKKVGSKPVPANEMSVKSPGKESQEEKERMSDRKSVELMPETEFKDENGNPHEPRGKEKRPYREGKTHNRPHADRKLLKKSDKSLLPEGFKFVKFAEKSVFKKTVEILEEVYQTVVAEDENGNLFEFYLPADKEEDSTIDCFPGTMASAQMMTESVIDHYVLNIPFFRQWQHLKNCGLHLVRQTYINWMYTGYLKLKNLIPHLLEMAVQKDSVINCDETWIKVRVKDRYCKKYTWCLVNREMGIVIYFYKKGSRSRDAFKDILDGKIPKAVQTDGYNVYMYLENELTDVTHLCCMAHARAKFRIAYETANEEEALWFLENIGSLYGAEEHYKTMRYSPEEIRQKRNSAQTLATLGNMRIRLTTLLQDTSRRRSELLEKALRYMDAFWPQLVEYIKDGRYTIDNNEAERGMKPLANERKNSYFFGSHKMAAASAVYHSLIATCRKCGVSVRDYFTKVFSEIIHGNENRGNLLPMTIGLPVNKS